MNKFSDAFQKARPRNESTPVNLLKWITEQEKMQEWESLEMSHEKFLTSFIPLFVKRCFDRETFSKNIGITHGTLRVFLTHEAIQKLQKKHILVYATEFINALKYKNNATFLNEWNDFYSRELKMEVLKLIKNQIDFLRNDVVKDCLTRDFINRLDVAISFMLPRMSKPDDVRVILSGRVQIIADRVEELSRLQLSSTAQNKLSAIAEQVQRLREELGMVWHETQSEDE